MPADQITLKADTGRTLGTRPSRRLRREGVIPAVVYGHGTEPVSISVAWSDLRSALTTDAGLNAIITLDVAGDRKLTMVKEMQRHPVRRDVTHVDFVVVDRDTAIKVEVPVSLESADDNHLAGLVVDQQLFSLPIEAKPDAIPHEIVVSLAALTADTPIRAGDLTLPAGVTLDVDPEAAVVTAAAPAPLEAGEAEEAEEAAEPAAAADAEASDEAVEAESGTDDDAEASADEG